jgi:hypothetical protein
MARVTYRTRLQDLLAKSYLSSRDRQFITSLLATYNQKGYLSSGRAHWVRKLEARYDKAPVIDAATTALIANLRKLQARIPQTEAWDGDFVKSLVSQASSGRTLSAKQHTHLSKIKARYSPAALKVASGWVAEYASSPRIREEFAIMVDYYKRGSYYGNLVAKAGAKDFVPSAKEYRLLTENKYAKKILGGYYATPKYANGTMVAIRASFPATYDSRQKGVKAGGMVLILKTNATAPRSACAGNKVYRVLPIGSPAPVDIEERHLKKAPKSKK